MQLDAKLRRFQADSKYSCEIFIDLLRRSGRDATNRLQALKSCRKPNKNLVDTGQFIVKMGK